MIRSNAKLTALGLAIAGMTVAAAANSAVIRITNANNHEIPLAVGSTVEFDANGNLIAECALNASSVCEALASGTDTGLPTATLARNDTDADVRAGETIRLTWSSTAATVCNATETGPSSAGWAGAKSISNSTGQTLTLSSAGTYTFSLECFNSVGGSTIQNVTVVVGAADPVSVPTACTISGHPLVEPPGLTRTDKTWVAAWSAPNGTQTAVYPNSIGSAVPVGAEKGRYTVIPFVPTSGLTVNIFYDPAQTNSSIGYTVARPAQAMFMSISPCPGDLRPVNDSSSDPFERSTCRLFANTGSLFYTTGTSTSLCRLVAGTQYYLNVAAIDTSDGLQSGENSCGNTLSGCDVQAIHRAQ